MSNYRFNLKNMINQEFLAELLENHSSNTLVASILTEEYDVPVSRQNVEYWRRQAEAATPGSVNRLNTTAVNRAMRNERVLRTPSPADDEALVTGPSRGHAERILVIPDLHAPYHHPDAFAFLEFIKGHINPDLVINLGDETDGHAISFHNSDPNLDSAGVELQRAREAMAELHNIFPDMSICHSNHGSLVYRRARAHGIPVEMLRTYREILFPNGGGEGWSWNHTVTADTDQGPVLFKHQASGDIRLAAAHEGCNLVVGHQHSNFEIKYGASSQRLYYGATAGCLVDNNSMAFAYGREFPNKPILGCMVIAGGVPTLIPMVLDEEGRWVGY